MTEKKPKRGRPKLLDAGHRVFLESTFPGRTARTIQNKSYQSRAIRLVMDKPEFLWLVDERNDKVQQTTLAELGRIDDDDDLVEVARIICDRKMRTREAVAAIRRFRGAQKEAGCLNLTKRLVATIKTFLAEHPDTSWDMVKGALENATYLVGHSAGEPPSPSRRF